MERTGYTLIDRKRRSAILVRIGTPQLLAAEDGRQDSIDLGG